MRLSPFGMRDCNLAIQASSVLSLTLIYIDIHLIKKQAEFISSFSILFLKNMVVTSKTCLKRPKKRRPKIGFQD